ncbi:hypothetical protein, partial [Escherichia coli]|uniref:hypothetical protein n=1 Tax=Escherichia coli TaxID=562 RepID=UPI0032104920|nr:hypothetical protein [Escherichia coli]
ITEDRNPASGCFFSVSSFSFPLIMSSANMYKSEEYNDYAHKRCAYEKKIIICMIRNNLFWMTECLHRPTNQTF